MTPENKILLESWKKGINSHGFGMYLFCAEQIRFIITQRMQERRRELDKQRMSQVADMLNCLRQFDSCSFRLPLVDKIGCGIQLADDKVPALTETLLIKGHFAGCTVDSPPSGIVQRRCDPLHPRLFRYRGT